MATTHSARVYWGGEVGCDCGWRGSEADWEMHKAMNRRSFIGDVQGQLPIAATTLPRPEVKTNPVFEPGVSDAQVDITISRESTSRTYRGRGASQVDAVSDAVGKAIADPISAEWITEK